MKRTQLYQKAVSTYGISAQEDVLLEEMAELSKVILKGRREKDDTKKAYLLLDLVDEIADVEIMLEQMKQHFGIGDEVKARKRFKKERLGKRLDTTLEQSFLKIGYELEEDSDERISYRSKTNVIEFDLLFRSSIKYDLVMENDFEFTPQELKAVRKMEERLNWNERN